MNEMTYSRNGDYYIPDITISQHKPIGHCGMLRKAYLKGYRPVLYNQLVLSKKLYNDCAEVDEACRNRMELIIPELAKVAGATEALKAADPMKWVGLMNCCKVQAEEIIKSKLIYV